MTPAKQLKSAIFSNEQLIMISLAVVVGVLSGYGAVGFRYLISITQNWIYGHPHHLLEGLAQSTWWWRILAPGLAGLIVGPMIYFVAKEAKGHGVPEVMEAVALAGGIIRKRVVAVKSFASAFSIAAGGSIGQEGPIVQIASAIGSTVGQLFKVSPNRMRILVACGAAAGIAATFNAPVAGMIFAVEIILGEFAVTTFSPIVIAAVMATAVCRYYLGDVPVFEVPEYHLVSGWELIFHAILGAAVGLAALSFTVTLYKVEDIFDAWKFPEWLKCSAAGLLLGGTGLLFPWVLGGGYETINMALADHMAWWLLLALLLVKILATDLTIGGGMSGGIFAPSLFIGAMVGGAFGHGLNHLFPGITASPGAYAIVGMGAAVAGATHAPLTAFIILFELTGGYKIILPLMIATIISTLVASQLKPESIYTLKLVRRGINIRAGREINLMRSISVEEAMSTEVETVREDTHLGDFMAMVAQSKFTSFPVVDDHGRLTGIMSHANYGEYVFDPLLKDLVVVKEVANPKIMTVLPTDNLETALTRISSKDFSTLPVIDSEESRHLVGIISRSDILSLYSKKVLKTTLPDTDRPDTVRPD